jgi:hypothetical protein
MHATNHPDSARGNAVGHVSDDRFRSACLLATLVDWVVEELTGD